MTLLTRLKHAPKEDKVTTGLTFTDVLFGFVIKELFTRLSDWRTLSSTTQAHLLTGTVLVLGSYIGFRKSVHRGNFQVYFVNLPLVRFIVDQAMVVLYFRFATATGSKPLPDSVLLRVDLNLLTWIFVLYVAWDLISWWMAESEYGLRDESFNVRQDASGNALKYEPRRAVITSSVLVAVTALRVINDQHAFKAASAVAIEVLAIVALVAYRMLKDAGE
jgi:hypothetical protein